MEVGSFRNDILTKRLSVKSTYERATFIGPDVKSALSIDEENYDGFKMVLTWVTLVKQSSTTYPAKYVKIDVLNIF